MHYRSLFVLTLTLWSVLSLSPSKAFSGEAPFKRATVQSLRNQVRLLLKDQPPRPAKRLDIMIPGDALATARTASAELTFNDSTIARLGEQALFRFLPNVRDFRLDNGTLVLLIPPGLGGTRVRTPNAAAGIRGSALFVRYNPDTNTTLVGALTNSQIEVSNQDDSQKQVLKAGQMAVIVQGRIERVYDFDLNTFYETSELVKGLDLTRREAAANSNPAIAAVQAETAEAIRTQVPVIGQGILTNPAFVRLGQPGDPTAVVPLGGVDRNIPNTISPVTGVAGDLQRVVSGKQTPSEPTTPVVGRTPSTPERPSAPVGGRPAPLPEAPGTASIPTPPGLPSLPSQPNPTAPSARPAPLPPDLPVPPTSEGTAPAVPQPPAVAQPAPAPLCLLRSSNLFHSPPQSPNLRQPLCHLRSSSQRQPLCLLRSSNLCPSLLRSPNPRQPLCLLRSPNLCPSLLRSPNPRQPLCLLRSSSQRLSLLRSWFNLRQPLCLLRSSSQRQPLCL